MYDKTKTDLCASSRTNVKHGSIFVLSTGISFSDPLSGNVRIGVENVSSPSKTLMANGADNNSIFTFQTPRGSGLYLEQRKW